MKPRVAFVCVHNSCRSQIAEALGHALAGDAFESYSAGTALKAAINPDAVRLMKQLYGIDIFVILDYVTGIMCAVNDRKLSSAVGFRGICRKVLIFLLVGVAHIVDLHVVGSGSALRGAVVCFYLSNEGVSMLENAAHLGLPVPEKLKAILEQLHDRESPATPDDTTDNTNDGQ